MKTASRIVGTAAFRQGYYAQDSPVYGAERRGAPMVAFTRFDSSPILERGMVSEPDLAVIADESLLADPLVRPLQGLRRSSAVLINSTRSPEELRVAHAVDAIVIAHDLTGMALAHTGSTAALSVALGAATARLAGLEDAFIERAVVEELTALQLASTKVERNLELAHRLMERGLKPVTTCSNVVAGFSPRSSIVTPTYEGAWRGTASVASAPNTPLRKTGDWRVMRPSIDVDLCTHCWICFVTCPDGAIALTEDNLPQIDYGVCKGCLMCAEECPIDAIETEREREAAG